MSAQNPDRRDFLVMQLRGLALRMQGRVEAIEDRDGKEGAITGTGVGIGYLLARDLAKTLSEAADFIDGVKPSPSPPESFTKACEDCPPIGYTTHKTRCAQCPRLDTQCMAGIASNLPCRPDDTLKRCTICGFVIDTQYAAEKPTTHLRPTKDSRRG